MIKVPGTSRDRMLEAAIAVIEERGEAGLRVDEVAEAASVAKPSLYHFFGSREGLVAAAQAERYRRTLNVGLDEVLERVGACTSADEFAELLRTWMASFSTDLARRRRAVRIDVLGSSVSRPDLRAAIAESSERTTAHLVELVEIARARGWAPGLVGLDPDGLAVWIAALWNGRYLAEISDDPARMEGWDAVARTAVFRLLRVND